jgi:hypothetical protein
VLTQRPNAEDEKKAKRQLAVCHANRAAAYLLPGAGLDAKAVLEDGKRAEDTDPTYEKAYVSCFSRSTSANTSWALGSFFRQAVAHQRVIATRISGRSRGDSNPHAACLIHGLYVIKSIKPNGIQSKHQRRLPAHGQMVERGTA